MTLVGVGSVTSDGSLDEKESEEFGRLQRQQVNDSSPLLALANGGTNADIVSSAVQCSIGFKITEKAPTRAFASPG